MQKMRETLDKVPGISKKKVKADLKRMQLAEMIFHCRALKNRRTHEEWRR